MNSCNNERDSIIGMEDVVERTVDAQVSRRIRWSDALNRSAVMSMPGMNCSPGLQGLLATARGKRKKSNYSEGRHQMLKVKQKVGA